MAFNHRIFVVALMNIDYYYDSNAVFCDNTFLSKHGYTCMRPGVRGLKSIQQQTFSL